ncbi:MAG: carbohydate-binding domain-containing protein [Chryseolinea sp.]
MTLKSIIARTFVSAALVIAVVGCKKETTFPADKIAVKWELITNFTDSTDVFNARFVLTNNSEEELPSNWNLFFSMAPRPILKNKEPQPAIVHHINGDWYKLTPGQDFVLEPGKSIEITYRGTEAVIKNTDRPLGLYFVFYDGATEKQITEVSDYTLVPFSQATQVNRRDDDQTPVPTPDWLYKDYQSVQAVADNKLSPVIPTPAKTKRGVGYFEMNERINDFV